MNIQTKEKAPAAVNCEGFGNQSNAGGINQFKTNNTAHSAQKQQLMRPAINRNEAFRLDEYTKHKIYDSVLNCLSNPQIRHVESGRMLPFVLHPDCGSKAGDRLENEIVEYAENHSTKYEVWRSVPRELCEQLKRENNSDALFDARIVPLPNWLLNCFICEFLLKTFSRRELLACPGFIEIEAADEKGILRRRIEMDISDKIIRRGFMLPVFRGDLICALEIYRHVADDRPFRLRSRFGGLNR